MEIMGRKEKNGEKRKIGQDFFSKTAEPIFINEIYIMGFNATLL